VYLLKTFFVMLALFVAMLVCSDAHAGNCNNGFNSNSSAVFFNNGFQSQPGFFFVPQFFNASRFQSRSFGSNINFGSNAIEVQSRRRGLFRRPSTIIRLGR
jgi:hypothetical protein